MVMDSDPTVVAFAAQPFWLLWPEGCWVRSHAPDFFPCKAVGTPGVTVIEPDHLPTAVHQSFHKLNGPADALRRGAHDQQNGGVIRATETLSPQPNLPGTNELLLTQ
jgi:hypothetical protein